ncbi:MULTISPECIES: hypothetical protein [Methylococcus]|uniref:Uncharacterized protein n=1 Tax=Methylococcus capsulatus (strain ATCC 33009 / NCIMB 11132 / Bath) TaxID=243233 RepID=Q602V7_METCA|nr:hypothetical protein [Methylococcus capsulatus]AAU90940.1 hypothetical protein MCA2952 [Methylococcus capsulatus str. Bath]QXP93012.1 hypothetical protein KW113_11660 [Methylococcus capsulatus]
MTEERRERALKLLEAAVAAHGSFAAVAKLLGLNRATISTVARRCYPGDDAKVLARVLEQFDQIACPYLRRPMAPEECRSVWSGATPSHDPALLAHRRACRSCPHKGDGHAHS